MSKHKRDATSGAATTWQPIGLPTQAKTPDVPVPSALIHDLSVARARRTARAIVAPGVILAATLGVVSTAAASGMMPTPTPTASATMSTTSTMASTSTPTATTTSTSSPAASTTTSSTGSGSFLPTGNSLPGATLPIVGGFVSHAPGIFTGGLFGGKTVQTSASNGSTAAGGGHEAGHSQGGDACDFFLEHMWKNEDGIPVIGTNTHFLTFHTDPDYKNLPLSLFSGAIGNSQMPIIDIYGGPLGWIPIFNPSHVRGHGTDYATMLTGCGGMGLPIDTKTMSVNLDRLPTPEKALNFATKVIPTVPSPEKILAPDYLYNTLRVDEITSRIGPDVIFTPDEYLSFATKNFDAFRLLWQTALEKVGGGNPAAVLDVLKITDNIKTFQSLGLPGLPGSGTDTLTGGLPAGGLTKGLPTGGLTSSLPTSSAPVVGPLIADLLGGTSTTPAQPGSTTPGSTTPGSTNPGSTTPGSTTPGSEPSANPLGGLPLLGGGDSPLSGIPVLGGVLGGSTTPSSTTPGSTTPGSTTPGSTTPSGSTDPAPASPTSPLGNLPVIGDLLGGATGSAPSVGTTPGSNTPGSTPSGSTTPGSTTPGSTTPGSTTPGSTTGSTSPGSTTPGSTTPSGSTDPAPASPTSPLGNLPVIGDLLGGATGSAPSGGTTPGSTTPGSATPGSTTPGTAVPASPVSGLPVVGDLLGGTSSPAGSLTSSLPTGGLLSSLPLIGSSAPASATPGSTTPGSTTPGSTTPGSTTPGSTTPGSTTPGSTTPGSTTPGSTTPGSTTPGSAPIDSPKSTVALAIGSPKVNGTPSLNAPGVTVPAGDQVTFTVPVTNTGDVPITTLVGKASDGGTMSGAQLPLAPGATTTLTYTTAAKPGTQSTSFGVVGSNPNGQQQGKSCSAVYTGEVKNGEVATTNQFRVNNQPASGDATYTFTSTNPSTIAVQVTNRGTAPLTKVTGTSPAGSVSGGKTTLAPGESTWFSIPVQPKSGLTTVPFNFTGTDATGKTTTTTESFKYTLCTCGASA
jgi:hypothetical protein